MNGGSMPRCRCGLIGTGIAMSLSPALHEAEGRRHGLDLTYTLFDAAAGDSGGVAARAAGAAGAAGGVAGGAGGMAGGVAGGAGGMAGGVAGRAGGMAGGVAGRAGG